MYVNENVNPKKIKTSDCVVRAIAKAENKEWLTVFDELTNIARNNFTVPSCKDAYGQYLNKYEKINVFHIVKNNKKRYTVKDICKLDGVYVIRIANHLVAVVNGKYYDTWDYGNKCAFEPPTNKFAEFLLH